MVAIDNFLSRFFPGRRKSVTPTETMGVHGVAVYGGFISDDEKNSNIGSREERYKTYSEILANTSIVAAGIRYFLNLVSDADWTFKASEDDTDGKFKDLAEESLTKDPVTPWHRIVRRAAMHRMYGFSIQEWTMVRHEDGHLTFHDVAPRAQLTIEKWDIQPDGAVLGVVQRSPQTAKEIYLPRGKLVYLVDDTLNDSPEGLGLFRHLVAPAQRLFRYEQLEGIGFETDLRGIPIGRGPFTELAALVEAGTISAAQRVQLEAPLRDFVKNHLKTAKLGMLLDSITYESKDEAGRASNAKQWDIELMKGSATSFKENAEAINRLNHEMARIIGVEQLMMGSGERGSFALAKDKTSSFFLMVDGALREIVEAFRTDLLDRLWEINGWPAEMKPEMTTKPVRFVEIDQVSSMLLKLSQAGAVLPPDDPIIAELREMAGVSAPDPEAIERAMENAALVAGRGGGDGGGGADELTPRSNDNGGDNQNGPG